ncbi:YbhB/YbcL family Raf kinase inhibitor-like protein, partial [Salmonella sp. s54836]|uniref:YbhB/YbcL family Raf kinase inhibitor-like protein n=1 Tax=Salmonella sp. s54836 TaxID=3159673 RepID=UPI003981579C
SGPPKGTGLHRYVFILLKQKEVITFSEAKLSNTESKGRGAWNCKAFVKKYNLEVVSANYYNAEWDESVPGLHKQLKL